MFSAISKKLFDLLVINTTAVASQRIDGNYTTVNLRFDAGVIEKMLKTKSSLGTYQQLPYRAELKWICLDFDCEDKENGNIEELKNKFVIPFTATLEKNKISYLVEFSGRRGLHVWIIFNTVLSKRLGYEILDKLIVESKIDIDSSSEYKLDRFPKTAHGSGKCGLMVKIPLSKHTKGHYSYFINSIHEECSVVRSLNSDFIKEQEIIIDNYKLNDVQTVLDNFHLTHTESENILLYKMKFAVGNRKISLEEIENIFSAYEPLNLIWKRVKEGNLQHLDRQILVGIFSNFKENKFILDEVFKLQNNYNPETTSKYLKKYSGKYFPITMAYLYESYNMELPPNLEKDLTALELIAEKLDVEVIDIPKKKEAMFDIKDIARKEKIYLSYDNEVLDPLLIKELEEMNLYTLSKVDEKVDYIIENKVNCGSVGKIKKYLRTEESGKERLFLSLCVEDRLLSTFLAIKFTSLLQSSFNSYSYNINTQYDADIFMPWMSSWNNFRYALLKYINLDFFEDTQFIKLDISNYYNSIYLHGFYSFMESQFDNSKNKTELKNILYYLSSFNEQIMRETTGQPWGVPQGPAYARIMAEFFLSSLIKLFFKTSNYTVEDYKIIRYVDDIYVIPNDTANGELFLKDFTKFLSDYNLKINISKTRYYSAIKDIAESEIIKINNSHSYGVKSIQNLYFLKDDLELEDEYKKLDRFIDRNDVWSIGDANFILNEYIDNILIERYLREYYNNILTSECGRGSIFIKFYSIIFKSSEMTKNFYEKEDFKEIPLNSINFKNYIAITYKELKTILTVFDDSSILILYLEMLPFAEIDEEEQNTIAAIQNYIKGVSYE